MQVRSRIVLLTLGLATLALLATGFLLGISERDRVDVQLDTAANRAVNSFRTLANSGIDPTTGERFGSTESLLYSALSLYLPGENETRIGFVGSQPRYVQHFQGEDTELDAELIREIGPRTQDDRSVLTSVRTPDATYRVAVLPVRVGDTNEGAYVVVFNRSAAQDHVLALLGSYAWIAALALLLAGLAGWLMAGRMLRPVRDLRELAGTISGSDLSGRLPVRGTDDLAELARTFNGMVDRLEGTFASQRQLLDDAGHELRTPITVVRGHLELMDPSDAEDAAETRTLALGELDRMHRLTDDLVMLARSDAPDFIAPRFVDLADMSRDVFEHAQQLGDREWIWNGGGEAVIFADPQRLTQAWLQLAANAVKFSAEGSTIELGSTVTNEVFLWVRDSGIGMSPDVMDTMFDRFGQGDPSRGGSGLGLPIVAAIAHAHGGRVDVSSTEGVGSVFTIVLPLAEQDRPPANFGEFETLAEPASERTEEF